MTSKILFFLASLGKLSREKICFYLDIVKIAKIAPAPLCFLGFLDTYKVLCRKKCNFLKSASNNLDLGLTPPHPKSKLIFSRDSFPY